MTPTRATATTNNLDRSPLEAPRSNPANGGMAGRDHTRRVYLLAVAVAAVAGLASCSSGCLSLFAPDAELADSPLVGELKNEPRPDGSTGAIDPSGYARLLDDHVDYRAGRVDYAGLKADRRSLDAYVNNLAEVDFGPMDDEAELATLINAYNAFTLELIIENYPAVASIKDLESPWETRRWVLAGHKVSLDQIEHGLIRPLYRDSRIHFAVNCASIGCPPLAPWPYRGAKLDKQLDAAVRRTLGDRRYARLDNGTLQLTSLMNWYSSDFVGESFHPHADTIAAYVARYADPEVRRFVTAHQGDPPVDFITYDWSLNDVR